MKTSMIKRPSDIFCLKPHTKIIQTITVLGQGLYWDRTYYFVYLIIELVMSNITQKSLKYTE